MTKTPWAPSDWCATLTDSGRVSIVDRSCSPEDCDVASVHGLNDLLNARLIAQAPDMYKELQNLLYRSSFMEQYPVEYDRIDNVLRKAKGES